VFKLMCAYDQFNLSLCWFVDTLVGQVHAVGSPHERVRVQTRAQPDLQPFRRYRSWVGEKKG